MLLKTGDKFILIGDSITDAGRTKPVGQSFPWDSGGYGNGYVNLVQASLHADHPDMGLHLINMGLSGNNTRDLLARWKTDVLAHKPQVVSILIGINDVWRHFDAPSEKDKHITLAEYKNNLTQLVKLTKPKVRECLVLSPYYLEPNRRDPMRAMMDRFGHAAKEVAGAHRLPFVDLQAAFDRVLQHLYPATLAWDRVHPLTSGHMVIAKALLQVLEGR